MKKTVLFFIALILCVSFPIVSFAEGSEKGPAGILTIAGVDEDTLNKVLEDLHIFDNLPYSGYKYFDNLNSMIMALQSGMISMINTDEFTAGYLVSQSDAFAALPIEERDEVYYNYAMVLMEMKSDGTMDSLRKQYIDDCIAGTEPEAAVPVVFEGADTLKVALTGDRPPMDYFSLAGVPAGFNTALMSEVAKRLEMNIQFISIDSGARAISLSSGESDVVFWSQLGEFDNWEKSNSEDLPEHTIPTHPYLRGKEAFVVMADSELAAQK